MRTKQPPLAGVFGAGPVPELGQEAEWRLREDGKPPKAFVDGRTRALKGPVGGFEG